jgi:cytochrome c
MNTLRTINTAALAITAATCSLFGTPAISADASALAAKYNCQACHAPDNKIVGPSYKEVAAKYAGDAGALVTLQKKVKDGGSGVWGQTPMPPNNVPDADLKALVTWILASK